MLPARAVSANARQYSCPEGQQARNDDGSQRIVYRRIREQRAVECGVGRYLKPYPERQIGGGKAARVDRECRYGIGDRVAGGTNDLHYGSRLRPRRFRRDSQHHNNRGCGRAPHAADVSALGSSTGAPRMRTDTTDETPGSCMVTPYTTSAASVVVRGLCVMTMNCVRCLNSVSMRT